ncbi:hypothetical protein ACF073_14275 [Streptomyces sp. NPDC015171]|uniref:hypothetical protein n=1 Tax=Streptomyces sp. NPDC015171 TaxID=3364945 RepID=UPI0036FFB7D8
MSADRENHEMTQTDIAFLLADAADEVEIGIAPVQAVIRGGRRRRARRWAVAAATTLVLAGSTGALAVTGLPGGGHGDRGANVATHGRDVEKPRTTELARGTDRGRKWSVVAEVWAAPRDRAEAVRQLTAMKGYGIDGGAEPRLADLVGKTSYYAILHYGDSRPRPIMFNTVKKWEELAGTDMLAAAIPLAEENGEGPERLVVGTVPTSARHVSCTWKNGDSIVAVPVPAAGSPVNWFVCAAPEGTRYADARVIP